MTRRTYPILAFAAVVLSVSLASGAMAAEDERLQHAVEARQGLLKVVVTYFGPIAGMARGLVPYDGEVVRHNAERISVLLPMIPELFSTDTRGAGVPTEALDHIWDNREDFAARAANAAEAAAALAQAAEQGEAAAMAAFRKAGGACRDCHDEYREQD